MGVVKLYYGSTSGNTEQVAALIAAAFGDSIDGPHDIAGASPAEFAASDKLILGTSTWEMGALQKDWGAFVPHLRGINLAGKQVALFGLGDAHAYSGLFVNGLRILHDLVVERGAEAVGRWPVTGYDFERSEAVDDGDFLGLVIDQENQSVLTHERVVVWARQVREEFGLHSDDGGELHGVYNPPPKTSF
jgi:flavodoxin I